MVPHIIDTSKCLVVGDVHGEFGKLNTLIDKKKPSAVIQVGDFGFWPNLKKSKTIFTTYGVETKYDNKQYVWHKDILKNKDTKIFWCDGNHEDFWALNARENDEVAHNVFYMPRGSIAKLSDGRTALFIGGALSIDKASRTLGISWFPEETIKYAEVMNLPDQKIDVIFSHTCPKEFLYKVLERNYLKASDPSYEALSYILNFYKPDLWYFGHWHAAINGSFKNTKWFCLNMAISTGWFRYLLV